MKVRLALLALGAALALLPSLALARYLWCALTHPEKAWGIARAFDRVLNVAANGSEYETVSTRAERARRQGRRWGCVLCRWLDALDDGHCHRSAQ